MGWIDRIDQPAMACAHRLLRNKYNTALVDVPKTAAEALKNFIRTLF
jgi:hypothetical protein